MGVTLDQVMAWHPCYDREKVETLFAGRETLTANDILDLPIPAKDKLWAVLREEVIPAPILHEFACRCVEQALELAGNPDPRSMAAIDAKRAWLRGEISDQELAAARDAARAAASDAARAASAAAWAAAWAAASAAAEAAASDAAWAARAAASDAARAASAAARATAWTAAWAAARDAAREAQIEILRSLLLN